MALLWFAIALNALLASTLGSAKRLQPQLLEEVEAQPAEKPAGEEPNTVMVFRLPIVWDDVALKRAFEMYGTVLEAHVMPKRGFGEVQFQQASSVEKLLAESTPYVDEKTGNLGYHMRVGSKTLSVVRKKVLEATTEKPVFAKKTNEAETTTSEKPASAESQLTAAKGANSKSVEQDSKQSRRVYVGNINWRVSREDLKDHMRTAGELVFVTIFQEPNGRSKGCGIVEYKAAEDAQNAIRTLNESTLGKRKIYVREDREAPRARSAFSKVSASGGDQKDVAPHLAPLRVGLKDSGRLVYVGNLPWRASWHAVKDVFKKYGEVIRVDMATDENQPGINPDGQKSKGYASVLYKTAEEADRAIESLNGKDFHGRKLFTRLDNFL